MSRSCVLSEQDDEINTCSGYVDRSDHCSLRPRNSQSCPVSCVTAVWSPFSTPANRNLPLQSQCEGCLLWLTTKLTQRASCSVNWPAHPGFCFSLLLSVFPLGSFFFLPGCPIPFFHCSGQVFMSILRKTRSTFFLRLSHPGHCEGQRGSILHATAIPCDSPDLAMWSGDDVPLLGHFNRGSYGCSLKHKTIKRQGYICFTSIDCRHPVTMTS